MRKSAELGLVAPQQARSRVSQAKIFDAAEEILQRKEFDDIAIAEIAGRAGVSVGNFYTRFKSKDALLAALHERYETDRTRFLSKAFTSAIESDLPLAARIRVAADAIVGLFRKRRGVLRSFIMRHWRKPLEVSRLTSERHESLFNQLHKLLLGARGEVKHPSPEIAVQVGISAMLAVCREAIVLRPKSLPGSIAISDEDLSIELSRMLHAYLTTRPAPHAALRRM